MTLVIVLASMGEMDEVRCPYCVEGDNFKVMIRQPHGRYRCSRCHHVIDLERQDFVCSCRKCRELNDPTLYILAHNLAYRRS
jgi:hypothetical protein